MRRYVVPGLLAGLLLLAALWPKDGDARPSRPGLSVVYTGDVVGTIEPCG